MSLDIKQVIQIARAQFKELLPDLALDTSKLSVAEALKIDALPSNGPYIRLEEIERDGDNWVLTFSVPNPNYDPAALLGGIRNARSLARIAKVIVIDGEEGKLVALRERAA